MSETPRPAWRLWLLFATAGAALQLYASLAGEYGYFIDEFYYLACATHLDWGYVDHPPFSPFVLRLWRALAGDSLLALRLLPALSFGALAALAARLSWRLGAAWRGQVLAGAAVLLAPILQIISGFYSMNFFELLIWIGCLSLLVEIELKDAPRLWLAFGALAGLGLQNKHTIATLAIALGIGMVLTPARRHLAQRWIWIGLAIALVIALPNVLWQHAHDWISLEFYRIADGSKNNPTPHAEVLLLQVLTTNPGSLALWLGGLFYLFMAREGRLRHLGWAYLVLLAALVVGQKSRPDRIAGYYPLLFAAGGAWVEHLLRTRGALVRRALVAIPVAMLLAGVALAPIGLPLIAPPAMARYTAAIGVVPQIEAGKGKTSPLPQWWADRTGWEQLAESVENVLASLPAEERARAVVFAPSYGSAGALEHFGGPRMPPVFSTHNSYFDWGPPPRDIEVALVLGRSRETLEQLFEEVELATRVEAPFAMQWRRDMPVWICRREKVSLNERWAGWRQIG